MLTFFYVIGAISVYLTIGSYLGRKIFSMALDDTPTKELSALDKFFRCAFFCSNIFPNDQWEDRVNVWEKKDITLLECYIKDGRFLLERSATFIGWYTFFWPLFRFIPTFAFCLTMTVWSAARIGTGIGSWINNVLSRSKRWVLQKVGIRAQHNTSAQDLATFIQNEIQPKQGCITLLLDKACYRLKELSEDLQEWRKFVDQEKVSGKDVSRFCGIITTLQTREKEQTQRVLELEKSLSFLVEKIKSLNEMLGVIRRYERTAKILGHTEDGYQGAELELQAMLGAACKDVECLRGLYGIEQEYMERFEVPIEVAAQRIAEGESHIDRTIRKEIMERAVS